MKLIFMRVSVLLGIVAFLFILPSCRKVVGKGPLVTEDRTVEHFHQIFSSIPGEVIYKDVLLGPYPYPDSLWGVQIVAQQNVLDVIETEVVGGKLFIKLKNKTKTISGEKIKVFVKSPEISALELSGSGSIISNDLVSVTGPLILNASGSGTIKLKYVYSVGGFFAEVSGSGGVTVDNGNMFEQNLKISGSGYIHLENAVTGKAVVAITGSGDVKVFAQRELIVDISGSGNVYYKGTPSITSNITGSGKLLPLQ